MTKDLWAKALGVFFFMVWEAVLGKTRWGSTMGLAKAVTLFIVKTVTGAILQAVLMVFKRKSQSAEAPKEKSDEDGN